MTYFYIGLALAIAWAGLVVLVVLFFHAASKVEKWEEQKRRVSKQVQLRNGHCETIHKMRALRSTEPVKWTCNLPGFVNPCSICSDYGRCLGTERYE